LQGKTEDEDREDRRALEPDKPRGDDARLYVARMQRSEIRELSQRSGFPDFAALHPGYTDQRVGLFDN
jgi:hypothetical protein